VDGRRPRFTQQRTGLPFAISVRISSGSDRTGKAASGVCRISDVGVGAPRISHVTKKNKRIIAELLLLRKSTRRALRCVVPESYFDQHGILSSHKSRSPYDVCMHCPYEEQGPTAGAKPQLARCNSGICPQLKLFKRQSLFHVPPGLIFSVNRCVLILSYVS
jgi:hypothetical protein